VGEGGDCNGCALFFERSFHNVPDFKEPKVSFAILICRKYE